MISIVMPAFNEADFLEPAVREVVDGLAARGQEAEVVVVENGSTDATAAIARGLAEAVPGVRAVSLPKPDYGAALRAGFLAARGDVVANVDVDYYDLDFVETTAGMVRAEGGPDVVVGSKRAAGSDDQRALVRRLITSVFTFVLRRLFGLRVSDTHGMKAMKRATVLPVVERCRFGTDLFDTELVLRAERAGLGVTEVPVSVRESRPSRTSILRRGVRTVRGLVALRFALRSDRL